MTFDTDIFETEQQSVTAAVCENAALFGAAPERGEVDTREIWDADDATAALAEAFRILAEGVAPDGVQLADEREQMLWGFVNMLHAQTQRLDRSVDRLTPDMRDLQSAQDGSEVKARELELLTDRAQNLGDRRDAFEQLRDAAAEQYRAVTAETWRPRHGSHTSRTGALTSAAIDARDFVRARKDRETRAHLPDGTLVAIAGGKTVADAGAVIRSLDRARAKYADLLLVHGGGPGVEKIAAQWAERNGVHQVVCKPDWQRHGRAAPFRRNDDLLDLLPKGVIAFPGGGITGNLVDKARQRRHTRHEGRRVGRTASRGRVVHPARPLSFCSDPDDGTNTGVRLRVARAPAETVKVSDLHGLWSGGARLCSHGAGAGQPPSSTRGVTTPQNRREAPRGSISQGSRSNVPGIAAKCVEIRASSANPHANSPKPPFFQTVRRKCSCAQLVHHPLEVVAQRHQTELAAALAESAHQKMVHPRPAFERAELMLGQRASLAHQWRSGAHLLAMTVHHILMLPPQHPARRFRRWHTSVRLPHRPGLRCGGPGDDLGATMPAAPARGP